MNFLLLNLLTQFSKIANVYFLIIMVLQMIPQISISDGQPTMLPPLIVIVVVSMVKDIVEDYQRYLNDKVENDKKVQVYDPITSKFVTRNSSEIKTGQVVRVSNHEFSPCDLVIIKSSDESGICHVESKNLDGETNLKIREAVPFLHEKFFSRE